MSEASVIRTNGEKLAYYNFDKIFSFNAMWMFLIGARGLGKTYGAKKKAITAAIKKHEQFIYLRRYKEELKTAQRTFFEDIYQEFPDWDFRSMGNEAQMAYMGSRDDKKRPWRTIGYFIPLSTAQSQKSVSFPRVTTILFDEFIIEKGAIHYLPDEATAFTNFYSTVDRNKDKTKVFFMANSVTITNPYFLAYDIRPKDNEEFIVKADGFMVVHIADSKDFSAGVYKTRFGKFIQGTDYAEYAVESGFADNHDALVSAKSAKAKYTYTIETKQGTFSVWIDWTGPEYFIQEKRPKQEIVYTLMPEKMREGVTLMAYNDKMVQYLRTGFRNDKVRFDSAKSRNAFVEIFKR